MNLWHGTNQDFDAFDPDRSGLANPNAASRSAIFFACSRDVAESYARHAAATVIPDHHAHEAEVADLLERADRTMRGGEEALYERLILRVEDDAVDLQVEEQIAFDPAAFTRPENEGKVMSEMHASSKAAKQFHNIGKTINGQKSRSSAPRKSSSLWRKIAGKK